ncbi:unnamed protein product, partial [Musa banksii]
VLLENWRCNYYHASIFLGVQHYSSAIFDSLFSILALQRCCSEDRSPCWYRVVDHSSNQSPSSCVALSQTANHSCAAHK